MLDPYNKFLIN